MEIRPCPSPRHFGLKFLNDRGQDLSCGLMPHRVVPLGNDVCGKLPCILRISAVPGDVPDHASGVPRRQECKIAVQGRGEVPFVVVDQNLVVAGASRDAFKY